jgi:hypothetical protein
MSILLAAAILVSSAQKTEPSTPPWNETTSADGTFSFAMPAPANRSPEQNLTAKGVKAQIMYYTRESGALYSVQAYKSADPIPEKTKQAALDVERDQFVRSKGGKEVRQERISLDGNPGWDFTLEGPAPSGGGVVTTRLRFYLVGRTYYILAVMSDRNQPLPADATRFLKSFRLGGEKAKTAIAAATPEQALRTFLIALVTKDEPTLRAITLPTEDLEYLLRGQAVPADQIAKIKTQIARQSIRTLKPGEAVTLPSKRKLIIEPYEVTDELAVVMQDGARYPYSVKKVDGHWRVDVTPMIASRKAADAASKKAGKKSR